MFNFLFIIIWLFTKKRYALISLATILLGYGHIDSFIGFNSVNGDASTNTVQVMSYNLQSIASLKKKSGKMIADNKDRFINHMQEQGLPMILCTQETSYQGNNLVKESLKYPYSYRGKRYGTSIFSRAPILASGELDLRSDEASSAIWSDILLEQDTIRVYTFHLRSNKISKSTSNMLNEADLQSSKTWNSMRGILENYKNSTKVRVKQSAIIAEHANKSPYKTIFCGDFNDTPLSHVYHLLSKGKKDSFKHAGSGIGTTYAGVIPALRIDYILADERLDIIDHQIHKGNYSDHYPISAQIVLP